MEPPKESKISIPTGNPPAVNLRTVPNKRVDIQVLRAIAVILVFLYHLGIPGFSGGFIGVDVFFVISGYLVFGSMIREMDKQQFSFLTFLARRMKRLSLPSSVLLLVLVVFLLNSRRCVNGECLTLFTDIRAASLHIANIHFVTQDRPYFADLEPSIILHFWSLAVEEQLYLIVPLLTFAFYFMLHKFFTCSTQKVAQLGMYFVVVLSVISFFLLFVYKVEKRFFYTTTRLWEFAVGAIISQNDSWSPESVVSLLKKRLLFVGYIVSHALIFFMGMVMPNSNYPNALATTPVVLATAFIILYKCDYKAPVIETIGNMSYSIYLYHWPIIQLLNWYSKNTMFQFPLIISAVALSFAFAALSYHFVELFVQNAKWEKRVTFSVFFIGTLVPALVAHHGLTVSDLQATLLPLRNQGKFFEQPLNQQPNACLSPFPKMTPIPTWRINNSYSHDALWQASLDSSWKGIDIYQPHPWQKYTMRSNKTAVVVIGDSMSMHFIVLANEFAQSIGASFIAGTQSINYLSKEFNKVKDYKEWLVRPVVDFEIPPILEPFEHRLILMAGRMHKSIVRKNFEQLFEYWTSNADCVIWFSGVMQEPDKTRPDPITCLKDALKNNIPLEKCDFAANYTIQPKLEADLYDTMIAKNLSIKKKSDRMPVEDYYCWDGTCKAHVHNATVFHRDGWHFSQHFLKLVLPYLRIQFENLKCAKLFQFYAQNPEF